MSNTIIQIKRSTTTAVPTDLQPGELAYTSNGQVLFIGSPVGTNPANVIAIAGQRSPGTLTANQAVIPNANAFIDEFRTNKLVVGPDGTVAANITGISYDSTISGSNNSGTVLLTANAVKAYVDTQAGAQSLDGLTDVTISSVTNNDILVYDAAAGQWENHTIQGTANEVSVDFSSQNITIGLPDSVTITNALTTNTANVTDTTTSSNTTTGALTVAGGLGVAGRINAGDAAFGNTSVYSSVNGTIIQTGSVLATNTVNASVLSVGGWVIANNSGLFTSGVVNTNVLKVGNNTLTTLQANDTSIAIANGITLSVNGSIGTSGQVLASNGTGLYWDTISADITAVTAGNGLTGGGTSGDVTLDVGAGNGISVNSSAVAVNVGDGIIANSSGVFVDPGTGVTVNATGVHIGQDVGTTADVTFGTLQVSGNAALGDSTSDTVSINGRVNTNIIPTANVTYNLGNNTVRWAEVHAQNVHSVTGNFDGNVQIAGDLFVTGNVTTTNVNSVVVSDPLIYLAGNNYTSDLVDIGFVANYNDGTNRHTGLFRDASDGGVYKLFENLTQELSGNNLIDTADGSYRTATLTAYLLSGGLTTNSTAVTITANSTVNVAIVANTLSLTTALGVASGGTGKTSATNNAVLFGNTTGPLGEATGSNGQVLQITGNVPTFGGLDGGTF